MDTKRISISLIEYAKTLQDDDRNKIYFRTIANAVIYEDFIKLLPENQKGIIDSIDQNLKQNRGLEWVIQYDSTKLQLLPELYFSAIAYINDKAKNISHFADKVANLENNIETANKNIDHINQTADLISGATILTSYAKRLEEESSNHSKVASKWLKALIVSIIGFFVILIIVFFVQISELPLLKTLLAEDLTSSEHFNIIAISIKAALIFGYLQIPGFFKRNYFAEKHLEQSYRHRANVLNTLHAVYNTIEDKLEKDKIITVGATIAFSESESGYITRKEGAGDEDLTPAVLSSLIRK